MHRLRPLGSYGRRREEYENDRLAARIAECAKPMASLGALVRLIGVLPGRLAASSQSGGIIRTSRSA